ncbi:MAG: acyl-CoA thioesterase [Firmicutes bacterium]|nr:acyl-CoA thioesterase [Bacillota bacterium]
METSIRVRYVETDQMGVAYHANYLVWFEVGRTEMMREIGLPYIEFEKSGLMLPVLKAYCEYKHAAHYDDQLIINTRLSDLQKVRLTFDYEIRRESKLLARGYTEHAFINQEGKPVALKKFSPFLWNRLCQALEKQGEKGGV